LNPPIEKIIAANTHRLIRSVFPAVGIFDDVASADELADILELENWTNDRVSNQYGVLFTIPTNEWVTGVANATVIMAAFCHPSETGGRFNPPSRGAWYSAIELKTAFEETIFHLTKEFFDELGVTESYVHMRQYLADFDCDLHDVRALPIFRACYRNSDYSGGQKVGADLLAKGSNGVIYSSVRHPRHDCIACFRPKLVSNVRQGDHFEYRWHGDRRPTVTKLKA